MGVVQSRTMSIVSKYEDLYYGHSMNTFLQIVTTQTLYSFHFFQHTTANYDYRTLTFLLPTLHLHLHLHTHTHTRTHTCAQIHTHMYV